MTLEEELAAISKPAPRVPCAVEAARDQLTDEDTEAFNRVIADRTKSAAAISRIITARNIELSAGSIQRHRRKECRCDA